MADTLDNFLHRFTGPLFESGLLIQDTIVVKIQGEEFSGWQSVTVATSMRAVASSFTLNIADKWRQSKEEYPIMPGNRVNVYLGTEPVLSGYIEQLSASVSNDNRSIVVSGRSKTGDLVDSAAIGLSAVYTNLTLKQVAENYTFKFDIEVIDTSRSAAVPIPKVVVNQGESILELLERLSKQLNVLLSTNGDGNLVVTDRFAGNIQDFFPSPTTAPLGKDVRAAIGTAPGLFQGENVLFADSQFDETDRFKTYLVKSQIPGTDFVNAKDASTINGTAFDLGMARPRTKYIFAEKSSNNAEAEDRASWEAINAAARAASAKVVVQGWKDQSGKKWHFNQLVDTKLAFIGFGDNQYLIEDVEFTQDKSRGTLTTLGIVRSDAYTTAEPRAASDPKKDAGWDTSKFGVELEQVAKNLGF